MEIFESAEDETSEQFRILHNGSLYVQDALYCHGNAIKKATTGLATDSDCGDKECIQNFNRKTVT